MQNEKSLLPFSAANPVIYDNDCHEDTYTDEYILALASSGEITLKGIITTISFHDDWQKPEIQCAAQINGRRELTGKARRSGMSNFPDPVEGPTVSLKRPLSGEIEDTEAIDTPGSRLIVEEAKKADPEKPLVIIMGGQSTAVADAYLLDNSIAENVVVSWLAGEGESDMYGYNGWVDPWGTYIVISKFKTVAFGPVIKKAPFVPKGKLYELPDTELRQFMIEKNLPHVNLPSEHDYDAQPAIPFMRPDYAKAIDRKSFRGFDETGMPLLKDDENGNIIRVTDADKDIATEEWWRAMKSLKAYGGNPVKPQNTPYNGEAVRVPGIVMASEFDNGGEGIAYHCTRQRNESIVLDTAFRMTDHVSYKYCEDDPKIYIVDPLEVGEWLEYTIMAEKAGRYGIEVISASARCGGIFHLDIDGKNISGLMEVPSTGGWQNWTSVTKEDISLEKGVHILRLTCDSGLFTLKQFEISNG